MLHGEQDGGGPAGHAHLPVGVLDVAVGGLDRDVEGAGHLLGLQAAGQETDDLGFPLSQPGWTLDPGSGLAGRLHHRPDHIRVQTTRGRRSDQLFNSLLRRHRGAMGPRLRHRMKRVGNGEEPGGWRQGDRRDSTVVATPIEPFVVVARDLGQGGEERRTREDPFGVVGVSLTSSHSLAESGPGFSHTRGDTATRPRSCRCAARLTRSTSARSNRHSCAAETASFATPAECPE